MIHRRIDAGPWSLLRSGLAKGVGIGAVLVVLLHTSSASVPAERLVGAFLVVGLALLVAVAMLRPVLGGVAMVMAASAVVGLSLDPSGPTWLSGVGWPLLVAGLLFIGGVRDETRAIEGLMDPSVDASGVYWTDEGNRFE